jgi:hypothetical protein
MPVTPNMTGANQVSTNAQPMSLARRKLQAVLELAISQELMQYELLLLGQWDRLLGQTVPDRRATYRKVLSAMAPSQKRMGLKDDY